MKVVDRILSLTYMAMAFAVVFFAWEPSQHTVAVTAFVGASIAWHLSAEDQ